MRICSLGTCEYDLDIGKLMERRLSGNGADTQKINANARDVRFEIEDEQALEQWCASVGQLVSKDIAQLAIADKVNDLPINLAEKQMVLIEAIKLSRKSDRDGNSIASAVREYFRTQDALNLEGFLRFRIKDVQQAWDMCVLHAAEELLLKREYLELIRVLNAFVQLQKPKIKEAFVILNPDGSCTLSDDLDARVNYGDAESDGVVSALVCLAPENITVYDLSCGKASMLADVLLRVFEDRVKYYK